MSEKRVLLGRKGEELAASFLQQRNFTLLARNYRGRTGEIDIIAREGKTTVFIEVKTRQKGASYFPAEAVTVRKQRQISRTAQEFILQHKIQNQPARFDVISVSLNQDGTPEIDHIANAFDLSHDDC
ncbi:MAG: YraN family protein [Desulfobulbaceae bacterium]|nr:MAG: YraN family protein [Desulfobulbaceae bacterium]